VKIVAISALLLFALTPITTAQAGPAEKTDSGSLSSTSKETAPATGAGSTTDPTAEPKSGSLEDKGKENTDGGANASTNPTGKPATSDLSAKKTNN
jgi:hypothetical protein